jgi:hypothetical protein
MKKVQSVLGDHHDTVIARQLELKVGISAHLAGENAFSYGLLYGSDACDGERLRVQAWQTWKRIPAPLPALDAHLGPEITCSARWIPELAGSQPEKKS